MAPFLLFPASFLIASPAVLQNPPCQRSSNSSFPDTLLPNAIPNALLLLCFIPQVLWEKYISCYSPVHSLAPFYRRCCWKAELASLQGSHVLLSTIFWERRKLSISHITSYMQMDRATVVKVLGWTKTCVGYHFFFLQWHYLLSSFAAQI